MLTIDLLRHGELEGGTRYRGHGDALLTDTGAARMDAVWAQLVKSVDAIISSPLRRCRLPAERWSASSNLPLRIDSRLKELHYGDWEGKTISQINQTHQKTLQQWRQNPAGMTPPGGESMDSFYQRLSAFWQQLCTESSEKHLLIVGHSGVNRTLLAIALQTSLATSRRMQLPYGCWSRMEYHQGELQLAFHNRQP